MIIILSLLGLIFIPISLKFLSLPYLWIGLAWTFIFFVLMIAAKRQIKATLTAIYFNIEILTLFYLMNYI